MAKTQKSRQVCSVRLACGDQLGQNSFNALQLWVLAQSAVNFFLWELELLPHGNDIRAQAIAISGELFDGFVELLRGNVRHGLKDGWARP